MMELAYKMVVLSPATAQLLTVDHCVKNFVSLLQFCTGADLGFLKGGLFLGNVLVLEARGPRGHVFPRFFELEGAQGGTML